MERSVSRNLLQKFIGFRVKEEEVAGNYLALTVLTMFATRFLREGCRRTRAYL